MKEFENAFNKKYPLPATIEQGPVGRDFKEGCKAMWREALLWFWKTAEHLSPSDYELLEKELEDERTKRI